MNTHKERAERAHSEAPAEGDDTADPTDHRAHAQTAAEGEDFDDDVPASA